jgi:hypothetical protein
MDGAITRTVLSDVNQVTLACTQFLCSPLLTPEMSPNIQMHVVKHTDPTTWKPIENEWQTFWDALGLPKLLALVESSTHSAFEDIESDRVQ